MRHILTCLFTEGSPLSATDTPAACNLQQLYCEHHHGLRNWLRRRLCCSETAADLAQDAFVQLLQRQRGDPLFCMDHPRTYLYRVANGLMVDHFRRRAVERAYREALARLPEPDVISEEERRVILDSLQRLDRLLDTLPAQVRRAFLLSRLDGLTYAEIALQLGVSERTVKRHMQQAFARCLEWMLS